LPLSTVGIVRIVYPVELLAEVLIGTLGTSVALREVGNLTLLYVYIAP